jgi:hypothetical protein
MEQGCTILSPCLCLAIALHYNVAPKKKVPEGLKWIKRIEPRKFFDDDGRNDSASAYYVKPK